MVDLVEWYQAGRRVAGRRVECGSFNGRSDRRTCENILCSHDGIGRISSGSSVVSRRSHHVTPHF